MIIRDIYDMIALTSQPTILLLMFRYYYIISLVEDWNIFISRKKLELIKIHRLSKKAEEYLNLSRLTVNWRLVLDFRKWKLKQVIDDKFLLDDYDRMKFSEHS